MNSSNTPHIPTAEQAKIVLRIVRIVGALLCFLGVAILLGADFINDFVVFDATERMIFGGVFLLMGVSDLIIVPRFLENRQVKRTQTRDDRR